MAFIKRGRGEILHDDPEQEEPEQPTVREMAERREVREHPDADEHIAFTTGQRPSEEWD